MKDYSGCWCMPLQQKVRNEDLSRYSFLPTNVTELDRELCGSTSRTGQLCGQCMEDCSLPVYSYYPQCVNCTGDTNNWAKYLAVSLLPTTAFFTGALVSRFRATSPLLNGYIIACQILTSPPIERLVAFDNYDRHYHNVNETILFSKLYIGCISIWILNFFSIRLFSFLPASRCFHTANTVSGLHHSSLPPCPHHPHLHTSQTPLPQLHTCGVAVEALHWMLCSLSKAMEHSKLTRGCLCNFPPPLLRQVLSVSFDILNANFRMGHGEHNAASCTLL